MIFLRIVMKSIACHHVGDYNSHMANVNPQ